MCLDRANRSDAEFMTLSERRHVMKHLVVVLDDSRDFPFEGRLSQVSWVTKQLSLVTKSFTLLDVNHSEDTVCWSSSSSMLVAIEGWSFETRFR